MKMTWGVYFGVVLFFFTGGCIIGYRPDDLHGRAMPKHPIWTVKTTEPDPKGLIRYDGIYAHHQIDLTNQPPWEVLYFWRGGQILLRDIENPQDPDEVNSLMNGTVGYFQIENNHLIFQTYTRINFGQHGYGMGRLNEDGDILLVSHGPTQETQYYYPMERRYFFIPMKRAYMDPDW